MAMADIKDEIKKLKIRRLEKKIRDYEAKHADIDSLSGRAHSKGMLPDKMFAKKYLKWQREYEELTGKKHW